MSQYPFPQDANPSIVKRSISWRSLAACFLPRRRPWHASSSRTTTTSGLTTDEVTGPIEHSSPRSHSRVTPFRDKHDSYRSQSVPNPSSLPCCRNISALWLPGDEHDPPAYFSAATAPPLESAPSLNLPKSAAALPTPQSTSIIAPYPSALPTALPSAIPLPNSPLANQESISPGQRQCPPSASSDSIWRKISHEDVPRGCATSHSLSESSSLSTSLSISIISVPNPNTSWESLLIPLATQSDESLSPSPPPLPPITPPLPLPQQAQSLPAPPLPLQTLPTPQLHANLNDSRISASTLGPPTPSDEDDAQDDRSRQRLSLWTVCGGLWFREGLVLGNGVRGGGRSGGVEGEQKARVGTGAISQARVGVNMELPCALGCCGSANGGKGAGGSSGGDDGVGVLHTTAEPEFSSSQALTIEGKRTESDRFSCHDERIAGGGCEADDDDPQEDEPSNDEAPEGYEANYDAIGSGEEVTDDREWHGVSMEVVAHQFDEERGRYVRRKA